MVSENLVQRLSSSEDNFIERKSQGANRLELRKTVVGFANSVPEGRSAVLFVGVDNSGNIAGCANPDEMQKRVRDICENDCYPHIRFTSEVLHIGGKDVVAVVIPHSDCGPHFSGPAYIRRGSETVVASPEVFEALLHSRTSKVAAILKLKNSVVSVSSLQHRLGKVGRISDSRYVEHAECMVLDCDPHTVRLQHLGLGEYVSEPLDNVQISRDEMRHRPMLIVSPGRN